jgi:hypothetical protein
MRVDVSNGESEKYLSFDKLCTKLSTTCKFAREIRELHAAF